MSVDAFGGDNVSNRPQIVIDVSAGVRLGDHWQAFFRPWFREARPTTPGGAAPPWDAEVFQAGLRYERPGAVGTRVDLGYIVSPIGLGLLDSRANLNPTIAGHASYFVPLPSFEPTGPRASAITSTYPLGAAATVSAAHWDARAAVVTSSPTRAFMLGNSTNPRQTANVIAGAGVTPTIGLRLGVSVARGAYATSDEVTGPSADSRDATIVGAEGEYSFAYTVIRGEVLRTAFETAAADAVAYEWFIQASQTLTPRWFVAARHEGTLAPPTRTAVASGPRTNLRVVEATAGFRVTPEVTLRASYYARRLFGVDMWDNQAGASIVWARRWW
ncbi:MAG TPA: hypothetical protein VGY57_15185 [Vicinamibacterales bacterium]|nr:hypothetical protein [Vicinamibacterales bacterium]